jgi:hypothetical protein
MNDIGLAEEIELVIDAAPNAALGCTVATPTLRAIIAALRRGPVDDIPLCGGHADWWFTSRNHLKGDTSCVVCAFNPERPPSGEMGYEEYHDGIIGVFKMNADGSRNLLMLTPQASEQLRAMLAEASKEAK